MKPDILNKTSLILILLIFISSFSCKKDDNKVKIKGNVYDPQLNQAVSGAYVSISSSKITGGVYNPNYVEITSTTTDASGNYEMEITIEKVGGYKLFINKDKYFENEVLITTEAMEANDTYSGTYDIYPEAWINLHVQNVGFYYDEIKYHFAKGALQCSQCCNSEWVTGIGYSYDETTNCRVHGNSYIEINYLTKKGNDTYNNTDSVFCKVFETTNHEITF
ncbi:MAG: carboxypeptidase-like regulatory domain-containing protein [Saprospiraceae bacterium]|nr:carboxypeptidase-like regulatory domain-containing protein [Saprospiraceae bacterium]